MAFMFFMVKEGSRSAPARRSATAATHTGRATPSRLRGFA